MFDAFDAFEDMLEPRPKISSQFEYWLTSTMLMSTDFIAQQIQIRDRVRDCCCLVPGCFNFGFLSLALW